MKYKTDKIFLHEWWDIEVSYHPTDTGKIIINIPGAGGSSKGYLDKYVNLGNLLQNNNSASFVRIPNDRPQEFMHTARTVINYCLENAEKICGSDKPEIWLMGFSAGGASALLTAWEYPEICKVFVINPFLNLESIRKDIQKHLPMYEGELFVLVGEDDTVISPDTLGYIQRYAKNVKEFQSHVLKSCDHQLKGEDNSKILSQLPEYYFLGKYKKEVFPIAKNGTFLLKNDVF